MELVPWLSFLNFRGYWEWSGSGLHLPPRPKGGLVDTLRYQRKLPVCNILKYRKVLVEPDVPRLGRKPGVSPAETLNVESAEITPFLSSPDNFTLIPLSAVHQGLRDCAEKKATPGCSRDLARFGLPTRGTQVPTRLHVGNVYHPTLASRPAGPVGGCSQVVRPEREEAR